MDQANADRDLNRVLGFFDSSYVDTDWRGNRLGFAEFREQVEQNFPHYRRMSPSTTVEDVQLQAGRMVVSYKTESHFQFNVQRNGWTPMISKATGETTWEKKGDQWKIIRRTTLRYDVQVDPQWAQAQMEIIMNTRYYDKDGR